MLGTIYYYGEGVDEDEDLAFDYFKFAADNGNVYSQYMLHLFYFSDGKYKNYEMRIYLPYEYSSWNIKKDYNYNLNNIKKGWELLHRAVNDWKYTIDTLDMNLVEDQIKDDIELFQSKYQSTFPGIKISNLKITETIADDVISYYNKYIENGARDVSEHSDWEVSFIFKFNDNRYKIYLYNYEIEQSSFEDALLQAIEELT